MRKFIVCLVLGLSFLPGAVPAQPSRPLAFNPVRSLTTWYTDRTPVDIEVVGGFDSKSVLRIRLERAFVQYLIARETTIVSFGLDKDTGIPASLFSAVSPLGELDRIPGVPSVPVPERLTRLLNIKIASNSSALSLRQTSDGCGHVPASLRTRICLRSTWTIAAGAAAHPFRAGAAISRNTMTTFCYRSSVMSLAFAAQAAEFAFHSRGLASRW